MEKFLGSLSGATKDSRKVIIVVLIALAIKFVLGAENEVVINFLTTAGIAIPGFIALEDGAGKVAGKFFGDKK